MIKPVAYAVVSSKGGICKLSITQDSAIRKRDKLARGWVSNPPHVKAMVFLDETIYRDAMLYRAQQSEKEQSK